MIRQLYQNKQILNTNIQEYGCYFVDLANIFQEVTNHQLEYETLNAIYVMCTRIRNSDGNPYMSKDCYIYDIAGISQVMSGLTGKSIFMQQVDGNENYNFVIGHFVRTTNSGNRVGHFVELYLDSDNVKRDPWEGGSKTAKIGVLDSKRFIKARLLNG